MQKNENKKTKTKKKAKQTNKKAHTEEMANFLRTYCFLGQINLVILILYAKGRKSPSDEHNSVLKLGKSSCRNRTDTTLVRKYQLKRLTRTSKYFLVWFSHLWLPGLLVQICSQPPLFVWHSFTSRESK